MKNPKHKTVVKMPENASQNHLDIDSSFPTPLLPHTHIELTNF